MTFATEKVSISRKPVVVVELDLDTCSLTYGNTPCTASGGAGSECYNTRGTCQDTANYARSTKTYRFVEPMEGLPADVLMHPMIVGVDIEPTRLTSDFGLGQRASVKIKFLDAPHHDRGIDPYVANRSYDATAQGTFWGKLRARNPHYSGRVMRVRTGYLTDPFNWNNFEDREYIIDSIDGPDSRGYVTVTGKDVLKRADDKRAVVPAVSQGKLSVAISTSDNSMSVVGGTYNDPVVTTENEYVAIGKEIIQYTGISGAGTVADPWVLSGLTRTDLTWGSTNTAHSVDDAVQQCKAWESVNVRDIIDELLVTWSGVDASYITDADWDTEEGRWLSSYNLTAIITEPEGVSGLIAELQEQCQLNIWWDEISQKVRLSAIAPPVNNVPTEINDDDHILADSIKVKDLEKDRLTQVRMAYDKADYTEDDLKNYTKQYLAVDADSESADLFNDTRIHKIESRWFDENNAGAVSQVTGRLLASRKVTPREVSWSVDAKDSTIKTGDVIDIVADRIQDTDGSQLTTRVLVISAREAVPGHRWDYVGVTGIGTSAFAFIGPGSLNDWAAESAANKLAYGFISDSAGKMSDGTTEAYKII